MDNIRTTLIASAVVLGIAIVLSVINLLLGSVFGNGAVGFVSLLVMVFFAIFGFLSLGASVLVSMDVLKSGTGWKKKISWILFVWFFGVFAAAIYYLAEKRLGISDNTIDGLIRMRPSLSMPIVALVFITGAGLLFGGVIIPEFGIVLLILGTAVIFVALYLSKNMESR